MKNKIVVLNDNLLLILTIIETIIRGNTGVDFKGFDLYQAVCFYRKS